jgi:hypothetical protein
MALWRGVGSPLLRDTLTVHVQQLGSLSHGFWVRSDQIPTTEKTLRPSDAVTPQLRLIPHCRHIPPHGPSPFEPRKLTPLPNEAPPAFTPTRQRAVPPWAPSRTTGAAPPRAPTPLKHCGVWTVSPLHGRWSPSWIATLSAKPKQKRCWRWGCTTTTSGWHTTWSGRWRRRRAHKRCSRLQLQPATPPRPTRCIIGRVARRMMCSVTPCLPKLM